MRTHPFEISGVFVKKICVCLFMLVCSFVGVSASGQQQPYIDNLPETEEVFASQLNDVNYQFFTQMSEQEKKECINMWRAYDEAGNDPRPDDIVDKVLQTREDKL